MHAPYRERQSFLPWFYMLYYKINVCIFSCLSLWMWISVSALPVEIDNVTYTCSVQTLLVFQGTVLYLHLLSLLSLRHSLTLLLRKSRSSLTQCSVPVSSTPDSFRAGSVLELTVWLDPCSASKLMLFKKQCLVFWVFACFIIFFASLASLYVSHCENCSKYFPSLDLPFWHILNCRSINYSLPSFSSLVSFFNTYIFF